MKKLFEKKVAIVNKSLQRWVKNHIFGIFLFNLILMVLILLSSAGYFHPYFLISINIIFFIGMILSIFLLSANSKFLFLMSFLFWVLAGFFKVFEIDIWAERTTIYMFQALFLGITLTFFENSKSS